MRGGNRQIALIGIEALSLVLVLSLWLRLVVGSGWAALGAREPRSRKLLIALLLASPLWLAVVYLAPLPASFWSALPGRSLYAHLGADAGLQLDAWPALSLTPQATAASLLAGIPLVAAFLAAYAARLSQLRMLLVVFVSMAFLEVVLGLLQTSGGSSSSLRFAAEFGGAIGTFANTNHFANYVAMALAAYTWLAWSSLSNATGAANERVAGRFIELHAKALWVGGGLILVLGILMSRSRGAALAGLPAAAVAVGVASLAGGGRRNWRGTLLLIGGVVTVAVVVIGAGSLLSKFDLSRLASDASFRTLLASTTLTGAREFWPWGAGWGSYGGVYPRFQPVAVDGYAEYAHQDYAQMLFEGGVFALVLAAAFLWLVIARAVLLARSALSNGELNGEEMVVAMCGLGLLGFLVHSLVEFNMHIPANAIASALLAGAYLRPLRTGAPR